MIGKKKFIVHELQTIEEFFGSTSQTEFKILKMLNISTKGIDRGSTKDIIDDRKRGTRGKRIGFAVTQELEKVTQGKDAKMHSTTFSPWK